MVGHILSARHVHHQNSREDFRDYHRATLAKIRQRGVRVVEHAIELPVAMRIEHGRWLTDCPSGSGVIGDAEWSEARCFACGAVFLSPVFPECLPDVEAALLRRPRIEHRNWFPGETVSDLTAENVQHGVEQA